jgi:hypothetical protein
VKVLPEPVGVDRMTCSGSGGSLSASAAFSIDV